MNCKEEPLPKLDDIEYYKKKPQIGFFLRVTNLLAHTMIGLLPRPCVDFITFTSFSYYIC